MDAQRHFRNEDWEDAITNAAKAFESTMKLICAAKGYPYDSKRSTINELVGILRTQGFFPSYSQDFTNNLVKVMETGGSMVRNKQAAHGRGQDRVKADRALAAYTLHMVAANMVFLVERYGATTK